MTTKRTVIIAGTVLIGAAGAGLLLVREPAPDASGLRLTSEHGRAVRTAPRVTLNNTTTIVATEDTRRTRDHAFKAVEERFEAEGVELDGAGMLTVHSQLTGGVLRQRLTGASVVTREGGLEHLARSPTPALEATTGENAGSVIYRGLFKGLDVEYRYDGKDIEELVHVGESLRHRLSASGAGLRLFSLFPELKRKDGALLEAPGGAPEGKAPPAPGGEQRPTWTTEGVSLDLPGGHHFVLPKSIATASDGGRIVLARTFDWTETGLAVTVNVPGAWLAEATGVVIDPATIDGPRSLENLTWPGTRSVVRDAAGILHVAYRASIAGGWHAMYARGDGVSWEVVGPIAPFGPCEDRQYSPTLAIDSTGTLHAVWADYNTEGCAGVRGTSSRRHRLHYAWCPDSCRSNTWQGGDHIYPVGDNHHYNYTLAVDANDILHLAFRDGDGTRYMSNDGSGWVNGGILISRGYYPAIAIDSLNQPHIVATKHYCYSSSYQTTHIYYDAAAGTWVQLANLPPPPPTAPWGCCYGASIAIDSADNVHLAYQHRDGCGWRADPDPWRIRYARWDAAGATWQDDSFVDSSPWDFREHSPSITVDDNDRVHVVWQEERVPERIMYANKSAGSPWSATVQMLPNAPSQIQPNLRWSRYPDFNRSMPADLIDLVYVEDYAYLNYLSTGAPVQAPFNIRPFDHTYTSETAPTFTWRRIGSDDGSNATNYRLEIDTTPLFGAPVVVKTGLIGDSYTLTGVAPEQLADGNYYYWRLQASNGLGSGPWGPIFELGIDTQPPSPFSLVNPPDNSDPGTRTPIFEWTESLD